MKGASRPSGTQSWRPRDTVVLTALMCVAGALMVVGVDRIGATEELAATSQFEAVFFTEIARLKATLATYVLALRAIAESAATHPSEPDWRIISAILRPYRKLYSEYKGMLGTLRQLNNTPEAIASWEAKQSTIWDSPIRVFDAGFNASVGQPSIWVSEYGFSKFYSPKVGRDFSARLEIREALHDLRDQIASGAIAPVGPEVRVETSGQPISVTSIFPSVAIKTDTFAMFTTVREGDVGYVFSASTSVYDFLTPLLVHSPHIALRVVDHAGSTVNMGGCALHDAISTVGDTMEFTSKAHWQLTIGQCPAYRDAFVTWKRWIFLSASLCVALIGVEAFRRLRRKSWLEAEREQAKAQQRVHSMIVGYVCHEVRNPLHVVKSTFEAVSEALCGMLARMGGGGGSGDDREECESMIADGRNAIAQMQGTVNDVLDLYAMTDGAFRLSRGWVCAHDALLPILRRCRGYLKDSVRYTFRLPAPAAIAGGKVYMDVFRVSQLITNAMSNAGKFVNDGGCVDVDVRTVHLPEAALSNMRTVSVKTRAGQQSTYVDSPSIGERYIVITVSNTRHVDDAAIGDGSRLFVPFKKTVVANGKPLAEGTAWGGVSACKGHCMVMREAWLRHRPEVIPPPSTGLESDDQNSTMLSLGSDVKGCVTGEIPAECRPGGIRAAGASVSASTGLGLPLSRAFAQSGGGWAGIEDVAGGVVRRTVSGDGGDGDVPVAVAADEAADVCTQFWAVMCVDGLENTARSDGDMPAMNLLQHGSVSIGQLTTQGQQRSPAPSPTHKSGFARVTPLLGEPQASEGAKAPRGDTDATEATCTTVPQLLSTSTLHVLLVDDEASNRRIGMRLLQSAGVLKSNITVASDGHEALKVLQKAAAAPDRKIVDVMLLDIMMPGMTGLELMARHRDVVAGAGCTVIAMTGSVEPDMVAQMKNAGITACLAKPFGLSNMRAAMEMAMAPNTDWRVIMEEQK